jgi:hypothetical protein
LAQQSIPTQKYMDHIGEVAKSLNISPEMQEENRIKLSKRGRKAKNSSK